MADDLINRGSADRTRINAHEPWERRYWSKHLGCTEQEVVKPVEKVGVFVEAVRRDLKKWPGMC